MANKTLLKINWSPKVSGVYYVTIAGTEYEVEVNDDWEMSVGGNPDVDTEQLIRHSVKYFLDRRSDRHT